MQVSPNTTKPDDENNDVRPGHMPQPNLREDVDEDGKPVLHKAAPEDNSIKEKTQKTDWQQTDNGSSSSGLEEKDIID